MMKAIYFSIILIMGTGVKSYSQPGCKYIQDNNQLVISSTKQLTNGEFIKYDTSLINQEQLGFVYIDLPTTKDTIKLDFITDKGNMSVWLINNGAIEKRQSISDIGNKHYFSYSLRIPREEGVYLVKLHEDDEYKNRRCTCALILCCYDITPEDWELVRIK